MARSVGEIKKQITDSFIANTTVRELYQIDVNKTFEQQFSTASIESIIFYVVAMAIRTLEVLFDKYMLSVDDKITNGIAGTSGWYHSLVMDFEYNGAKIIKHCAIHEEYPAIKIKVNKADYGVIEPESKEMTALRAYIERHKFAGILVAVVSSPPEVINIELKVWLLAEKYAGDGTSLDNGTNNVEEAINAYVGSIDFDGLFFKTKLIEAVNVVDGVYDMEIYSCSVNGKEITTRYKAVAGAFVANTEVSYVLV